MRAGRALRTFDWLGVVCPEDPNRKPYPSDFSEEKWAVVFATSTTLLPGGMCPVVCGLDLRCISFAKTTYLKLQ